MSPVASPIYCLRSLFRPNRRPTTATVLSMASIQVAGSGTTVIVKSRNVTPSSPPKKTRDGSDGQPSAEKSPVGEFGKRAAFVAIGKPVTSATNGPPA